MSARPRHAAHLLVLLLGAGVLAGCGRDAPSDGPARRIVLVSIDTLRADHLSCYGYPRETSPRLDALAEESFVFTRARAHSNSTAPSHMSLFTGVLPLVHDVWNGGDTALSPDLPTLAERLSDAGYRTAAFADGGMVAERFGFARGFDTFDSRYERFPRKLDRVEEWLDATDDAPAFLFVHTYGVHAPYVPARGHDVFTDPGYTGELRARVMALASRLDAPDGDLGAVRTLFWEGRESFDEADREYLVGLYDGCIRSVDAGVGRLLDMVDARGLLDDAWVIVTSDHGEAFLEHGSWSHRELYEEELHVPLLVRPPGGLAGGRRVDAPVGLVDLAATLLALGGVDADDVVQGRALLPAGSFEPRPLHAVAEQYRGYQTLVDGAWKLHVGEADARWQLYDLSADPREERNLLGTGEEADAVRAALEREVATVRAAAAALRERLGGAIEAAAPTDDELEVLRALGYVR